MKRFTAALTALATGSLLLGAAPSDDPARDAPSWDDPTGRLDPDAFADPPSTARPHAFWFWNGELTEEELARQLDEMSSEGVEEFFIHPREGLGGEYGQSENEYYLSVDWFDKVGFVLEEAAERGMKAWLYDDLNWPSGWAGGRTVRGGEVDGRPVEPNPEYVPWFLAPVAQDVTGPTTLRTDVPVDPTPGPQAEKLVATLALPRAEGASCVTDGQARGARLDGDQVVDLTDAVADGTLSWDVPAGDWCVLHLVQKPLLDYHPDVEPEGEPFVDMLNPDATQKFIDITHEVYAARFPDHLGTTVPGIFNDEPGFYNNFPDGRGGEDSRGSVPWTPGFEDYLDDHAGRDLTAELAALWYDVGDATTSARVSYYDALTDRYNDAHTVPLAEWADEHDMALISNPLIEEDLGSHKLIAGGSWFEMSRHYHLPGMDLIGGLNTAAITPKLNSSVAHLFDRPRNLAETFGAFGWDLTMEEMKRTVAWEAVGGVDLIDNHAFYYSTDGERAFESPPSQFFQNTFWPRFGEYARLVGRLTEPARGSTPVNPVGVLYPTTSLLGSGTPWDVRGFADNGPQLGPVDQSWKDTSNELLAAQLDFDYLDEQALADEAHLGIEVEARDGRLHLHEQEWQALVLPRTTVLDLDAVATMEELVSQGGTVVAVDGLAQHEARGRDAELRDRLTALFGTDPSAPQESRQAHGEGLAAFLPDGSGLTALVHERIDAGVTLSPATDAVRVRQVDRDGDDAYLVVNLSGDDVRTDATFASAGVPELWDPNSGDVAPAPVHRSGATADETVVPLTLDPYDAVWVVFRGDAHDPRQTAHLTSTDAEVRDVGRSGGGLQTTLVVDEAGPVYAVGELAGRRYAASTVVEDDLEPLALDGPWTVQLGDREPVEQPLGSWTTIDPAYSGSATYRTTVDVPAGFLDAEREVVLDLGDVRDLASVRVNGGETHPVDWAPWTVEITDDLRTGTNTVEVVVTNTPANEVEGRPLPSGLLGPVSLVPRRLVTLELERPGLITSWDVEIAPSTRTIQPGDTTTVTASLTGIAPGTLRGELRAEGPAGWTIDPVRQTVSAVSRNEPVHATAEVGITAPADAAPGRYPVTLTFTGPDGEDVTAEITVEVVEAYASWEFDTDAEGWTAANHVTPFEVRDSALHFASTGGDPYIVGPEVDVRATSPVVVEIEMTSSVSGEGEVFYSLGTGFTGGQAVTFPVAAGSGTYRVRIDTGGAPLTQLRLDPLRTAGELSVDAVRVLPG